MDFARLGIQVDTSGVQSGVGALGGLTASGKLAEAQTAKLGKTFLATTAAAQKLGLVLTAGLSAPLLLIAKNAVQADIALNKAMANVATLIPGNIARVKELKQEVQAMGIQFAQSTDAMAVGLFELISAFGDTADTVEILRVNTASAVAAQTDLSTSIKLTSAVTKAWGDTSAKAQQEALDMAFITNKLGQTSFPELAASVGEVTLLFNSLGASRQELFAGFAALTGVLGNTSKTATGLKGAVQGLLAPTTQLSALYETLGVSSGAALVAQEGFIESFKLIRDVSERTGIPLNKFIGSIEGIQAVLGLTGPQARAFKDALEQIENGSGALDQAVKDSTQGINALGFAFEKMKVRGEVLIQNIGEGLSPAFAEMLDLINPIIEKVASMAKAFSLSGTQTQKQVAIFIGLAVALGPLILLMTTLVKLTALMAGKFLLVVGTIFTVISAIQLLRENWEKVVGAIRQTGLGPVLDTISGAAERLAGNFKDHGETAAKALSAGFALFPELTMRQFEHLNDELQFTISTLQAKADAGNIVSAQVALVNEVVKLALEDLPPLVATAGAAGTQEWIKTFTGPAKRALSDLFDFLQLDTNFEFIGTEAEVAKQIAKIEEVRGLLQEAAKDGSTITDEFIQKFLQTTVAAKKAQSATENLTEVMGTLKTDLETLSARYAVFGDRVDIIGEKMGIMENAINDLLSRGISPANEEVQKLVAEFERLEGVFKEQQAIQEIGQVLSNTMGTMVDSVLRGTQSMKDAFKDLGRNIILAFANKAIQQSIDQLFTSIQAQVGAANANAGAAGAASGASGGGSIFSQIGSFFGGETSTAPGGAAAAAGAAPSGGLSGLLGGASGAGALGGLGAGFGIGTGAESFIGGGKSTQFGGAAGGALGGAFFGPAGAVGGSVIGAGIGKGLNALFGPGAGGKDKLSLRTGAGGALSVAGDTKGNSLIDLIQGIDDAVAARLTVAQQLILQEDIEGSKLKSSSRKLKDIVNEIAFKRLEQTLESLGASEGIDDLAGRVLTGEKFSEEKLQNTLNAIEFINTFESSVKSLNDGLLDIDSTVERLARESVRETQSQLEAFREETERLGLDVDVANDAIREAVKVMVGIKEAKEPLSATETALKQVRAEFNAMAPLLKEVGIAAEAAGQGLIRALGEIRQGFEDEIQRQINAFRSPITNTLEDLFATQAQRLSDAQAVNADMGPVVELIGEEFKSVIEGLDATQLQTAIQLITANVRDLGDSLGGDAIAALSQVFQPGPGFGAQQERVQRATDELARLESQVSGTNQALGRVQATANEVANIFESLGKFRQSLLQGQFSTLSPGARFTQAQGQFERTAAGALGGDVKALSELETVSEAFLQANQDYFASSNPKAFSRVLEVLGQAQSISELEFITAQQQAETLSNQLLQLEQQVVIAEDELQTELDTLAEMEALSLGQTEQTERLEAAILSIAAEIQANSAATIEAAQAATQAAVDTANATDVQTEAVTQLLSTINANVSEGNRASQQLVGAS